MKHDCFPIANPAWLRSRPSRALREIDVCDNNLRVSEKFLAFQIKHMCKDTRFIFSAKRIFVKDRLPGEQFKTSEPFGGAPIVLGPGPCAWPYVWLGLVEIFTKRAAPRIADRNLISAHSAIGFGEILIGRAKETESHIAEALRLSPRDTMAYTWMFYAGLAKSGLGSFEQAVAWFRRSIEANRKFPHTHFHLAHALAQLGRLDEERSAVKTGLALNPTYAISRDRAVRAEVSDDPTYLAGLELVFEGLRKAGAPEK
jgi:tetratricopeptide (TPR) repeat protein